MKQLSTLVNQAIHNLHIEALNPMQQVSIEAWKEGKDLIVLSPTGTGKTLAYIKTGSPFSFSVKKEI